MRRAFSNTALMPIETSSNKSLSDNCERSFIALSRMFSLFTMSHYKRYNPEQLVSQRVFTQILPDGKVNNLRVFINRHLQHALGFLLLPNQFLEAFKCLGRKELFACLQIDPCGDVFDDD